MTQCFLPCLSNDGLVVKPLGEMDHFHISLPPGASQAVFAAGVMAAVGLACIIVLGMVLLRRH